MTATVLRFPPRPVAYVTGDQILYARRYQRTQDELRIDVMCIELARELDAALAEAGQQEAIVNSMRGAT